MLENPEPPTPGTSLGEAFLHQVLASSADCIKVLNLAGELEFMSEGGLCVMEIDDFEPLRGACWPNFWGGEEHDKALLAVEKARKGGTGKFEGFTPTGKGNMRYWDVTVTPIRGPDGQPEKLLSISRDITEQHLAEQNLAEERERLADLANELEAKVITRTEELSEAVRQAEAFNYSISHDLRGPLRTINTTACILLEEAGVGLCREHRTLLERQKHSSGRLAQLIDELLHLSRLARVDLKRQSLNMTAEALSISVFPPGSCNVKVQKGMVASGDPILVRSLYQNLLDNACKFSPAHSQVLVGQTDQVFWVKDEGIGFEMVYAEKVFLPFERLVTEEQFPGTGIGLANAKRVVERHGGKIWTEAEPGKGATFFFTLAPDRTL